MRTIAAWRTRAGEWIESPGPRNTVIGLIVLNAALLGLATYDPVMAVAGQPVLLAENIIVGLFACEIAIRLFAQGTTVFPKRLECLRFHHRGNFAGSRHRSLQHPEGAAHSAGVAAALHGETPAGAD